ncbi:MAG: hypothetical protein EOP38_21325 [Rubrivivax sp.]|nr:MAG: hypothetical protein EOP38_21325 [Rubrivivax sp.]
MSRTTMPSALATAIALLTAVFQLNAFAQDRPFFEAATLKACMRGGNAQGEAASAPATQGAAPTAYCTCYAAEMAGTVPSDVLNTSEAAATPAQAAVLRQLAERASAKCSPTPTPTPAASR